MPATRPEWNSQTLDNALVIAFTGEWTSAHPRPAMERLATELQATTTATISIDTSGLADWDSVLASTLLTIKRLCQQRQLTFDESSLPEGMAELLALATALPVEPSEPSRVLGFAETWQQWLKHGLILFGPNRYVPPHSKEYVLKGGFLR